MTRTSRLVVGVPRETKPQEQRVAITPAGVREVTAHGATVVVETGAGAGSGILDAAYETAGARILESAAEVWQQADLVCKVKEPQPHEYGLLRPGLALFTYLHLAAAPDVARSLLDRRVTAIGYETVEGRDGSLPLLTPMSEIAGRLAAQIGAHYLERQHGGRGVLLGGVPGVAPGRVAVLGAGTVGANAAAVAAGMGAAVTVLSRGVARLRALEQRARGRLVTVASTDAAVAEAVLTADVAIGAVLVPGGRAPQLVAAGTVAAMQPGSVVIDVAVDQGGCFETTRETTHADPVYDDHGVVHYAVANMPGAVPHTATRALANATLPYLLAFADQGVRGAIDADPGLAAGVNTHAGSVTHGAVARALDRPLADARTRW